MNWPEPGTGPELGDGRFASAYDLPQNVQELREIVASRVAEGLALYPQGGKTALDYGEPPGLPGVAVDVRSIDEVIDYPSADMTITVGAGMTHAALASILDAHGQRLPLDVPHADRATLGGIFATATAGSRRFGAGRPRDLILGVGFVTSDGELVRGGGRVVKNVAGYDFPRLLTGSLGTLGILVEMTLKVRPRPEASAIAWAGFERLEAVEAALAGLNTSKTRPIALDLLNRPAAATIGEVAGLPVADWVLVVGFEDNQAAVRWQLDALRGELGAASFEVVEDEAARPIWQGLSDFADGSSALTLQATTRPSALVDLLRSLPSERWAVQCHAGNGVVHAHSLGEPNDLADMARTLEPIRAQLASAGGSLVLARCPTAWKGPLGVWGPPRGDWPLMERVKRALDPSSLMNPGRFVGRI